MKNEIKGPAAFRIGHAQNEHTGVTVVVAPRGAVGGVDVRGGAPGTRETDLMRGCNQVKKIHAVALCGGSAYGLEACCGVMDRLREEGVGFKTATHVVPIVTGAVIFDLNDKKALHFPDKAMGYDACKHAAKIERSPRGAVGAGVGATVGKIRGLRYADKGGLGIATLRWLGVTVTAVVVVNALGDVYDCETNEILAGAHAANGAFLDTHETIVRADLGALIGGSNTTIGVVLTDAKLTREEANKIAMLAHDGLARAIKPIHTLADGDTMFCMSAGSKKANFIALGAVAAEATRLAVLDAVRSSREQK